MTYPRSLFAEQYPDGFGELYDLAEDPWELRNRWFDPDCQATVAELQAELYDWLVTTTRPTSILGVAAPDPSSPQVRQRFNRDVLADNKLDPRWIAERRTSNYL